MSYTTADFDLIVKAILQVPDGPDELSLDDRYQAIQLAVAEHSRVRPQVLTAALVGNGTSTVPVPSGWVGGFSEVDALEYPTGQTPPALMDPVDWQVYTSGATPLVMFVSAPLPTGATALLRYTAPHSATAGGSTIPVADAPAVATLAASYGALTLSAIYTRMSSPGGTSDLQVGSETRAAAFRTLAAELRTRYRLAFGVPADGPVAGAASVFGTYTPLTSYGAPYALSRRRWW